MAVLNETESRVSAAHFSARLEQRANDLPELTKGERTRNRILAVAARILEESGVDALQMGTIAEQVGLSRRAIYKYFDNKYAVMLAVLDAFFDCAREQFKGGDSDEGAFEQLYSMNLRALRFLSANPGLMWCMYQLRYETLAFRKLWQERNAEWFTLMAERARERIGKKRISSRLAFLQAYVYGSVVNELFHDFFVLRNERFAHAVESLERVAMVFAVLGYRIFYGTNPPPCEPMPDLSFFHHRYRKGILDRLDVPAGGRSFPDEPVLNTDSYLSGTAQDGTGLTKGERTRNQIKASAARMLETRGFHGLQLVDVAKEVGITRNAIYKYFKNKEELALEVVQDFVTEFRELDRLREPPNVDVYQRVYATNVVGIHSYRVNAGMWRCRYQLRDALEEFRALWEKTSAEWCDLVTANILGRAEKKNFTEEDAQWLSYAWGALLDETLHQIYALDDPVVADLKESPEALADLISILAFRMIYARDPHPDHFEHPHPLLEATLP